VPKKLIRFRIQRARWTTFQIFIFCSVRSQAIKIRLQLCLLPLSETSFPLARKITETTIKAKNVVRMLSSQNFRCCWLKCVFVSTASLRATLKSFKKTFFDRRTSAPSLSLCSVYLFLLYRSLCFCFRVFSFRLCLKAFFFSFQLDNLSPQSWFFNCYFLSV